MDLPPSRGGASVVLKGTGPFFVRSTMERAARRPCRVTFERKIDQPPARASRELPRGTIGPFEHRVGFRVADDLFLRGVPADLAPQTDGDISEMTERRTAVADLDVADRSLPRFDAVEEILLVVVADLQMH